MKKNLIWFRFALGYFKLINFFHNNGLESNLLLLAIAGQIGTSEWVVNFGKKIKTFTIYHMDPFNLNL